MEKSVEGGSAEDVQGGDYWGIVEPGWKRNRGLALGRRAGERTGSCSTNARVGQGLLARPNRPGHHQGFSPRSQAAATGSGYGSARDQRRERRRAVRRTLKGGRGGGRTKSGRRMMGRRRRGRQAVLWLLWSTLVYLSAGESYLGGAGAGLADGFSALSPDRKRRRPALLHTRCRSYMAHVCCSLGYRRRRARALSLCVCAIPHPNKHGLTTRPSKQPWGTRSLHQRSNDVVSSGS
jgi:hypothetical protein